jgi:peptidoglycan/LPS O-acetylase OafA/YrhL
MYPARFTGVHDGQSGSGTHDGPLLPSGTLVGLLCLLVGLTAMGGGLSLVLYPDGSRTHLSLLLLRYSPFETYLVPGLVLSLIVGLGNMIAGVMVLRNAPRARRAALLAGAVLVGWIVCEMLLLRTLHWLQIVYLSVGLLLLVAVLAPTHGRAWRQ